MMTPIALTIEKQTVNKKALQYAIPKHPIVIIANPVRHATKRERLSEISEKGSINKGPSRYPKLEQKKSIPRRTLRSASPLICSLSSENETFRTSVATNNNADDALRNTRGPK